MLKAFHMKEFMRMMSFMKVRIVPYSIAIIGDGALNAGLAIVTAFIFMDLIDAAVLGDMSLLERAVITMLISLLVLGVLAPRFYYIFSRCVKKTIGEVKLSVFKSTEDLPVSFYDRLQSGDIISRMTNDIQAMEQAYSVHLRMLVFAILSGISSAVTMFVFEWRISLILLTTGIFLGFANTLFAKSLRTIGDKIQHQLGELTERLTDLLAGFHIIKMFDIGKLIIKRYDERNEDVTLLSVTRAQKNALLQSNNFLLGFLSFGGIMSVGAFMVMQGTTTLGKIMAIIQLINGVTFMFLSLGNFITQLQGSLAGAVRVFELLDISAEPERYDEDGRGCGSSVPVHKGMIEMQDVTFCYEEDKTLDKVTFSVGQGLIAALVGPSGGGKSTIVKLLLGFYPLGNGNITINGKSINQYSLTELRDMVAYVPQDGFLFNGTIEENIKYGRIDASENEIINAAKAANIHDFILELPDGYNTQVGERAVRLSGGEKQRIAIARALLKNAPILLLDEATSSLDSESEQLVQTALNELLKGRTALIIAHRLSTIEHADVIYVIDNGRVEEQGNHYELLEKGGIYRRLYEIQFKQDSVTNTEGAC